MKNPSSNFCTAILVASIISMLSIQCTDSDAEKKEPAKAFSSVGEIKKAAPVQPTFLFVSDIHLDNFKHQSDYKNDTGTDLWKKFLNKADSVLAESNSPAFILYTGDLPAHYGKNYLQPGSDRALHDSNMVAVLNGLRQLATQNNKPLFFLPGNNDAVAGDYYPFGYNNNYTPFSLIDETTNPYPALNINKGSSTPPCLISQPDTSMGYYSAYPVDGTRLIAMNTVIYTEDFFKNAKREKLNPFTYADNQMRWLSKELAQAKTLGEKVYIAMHVPPGIDIYSNSGTWTTQKGRSQKMSYTDQFLALTNQYKDFVEVVLYGHTHMDELRLLNDPNNNVTGIAISCPGISPVHQNNPGFKTVTYDSASKSLLDFTTHYTVLDNTPGYWGDRTYTFSSEFNKGPGQTMYQQLSTMPLSTITSNLQKIYKVKHGTGGGNIINGIEVRFTGQRK